MSRYILPAKQKALKINLDSDIYGNFLIKERNTVKKAWSQSQWHLHMPFCHQTLFTKTDIMKKELFDTSFRLAADHNFIIRMYTEKKVFDYIDRTLAIFSLGGFAESNKFLMNIESLKVLLDHKVPEDEIKQSYWYKAFRKSINYKPDEIITNKGTGLCALTKRIINFITFNKVAKI